MSHNAVLRFLSPRGSLSKKLLYLLGAVTAVSVFVGHRSTEKLLLSERLADQIADAGDQLRVVARGVERQAELYAAAQARDKELFANALLGKARILENAVKRERDLGRDDDPAAIAAELGLLDVGQIAVRIDFTPTGKQRLRELVDQNDLDALESALNEKSQAYIVAKRAEAPGCLAVAAIRTAEGALGVCATVEQTDLDPPPARRETLRDELTRTLARMSLSPGKAPAAFDESGVRFLGPLGKEEARGLAAGVLDSIGPDALRALALSGEKPFTLKDDRGQTFIIAVEPILAFGWVVASVEPESPPPHLLPESAKSLFKIGLGLFGAASAAVFFIVWSFTRPLVRLSGLMRELPPKDFLVNDAQRNALADVTKKHGDERGELAGALAALLDSLKARLDALQASEIQIQSYADKLERSRAELAALNEQLEQRIAERTIDLSVAVKALKIAAAERDGKEQRLRDSEARLRRLYDNALYAAFQTDAQGRLLLVNQTFADLFGYQSPDQVKAELETLDAAAQGPDQIHTLLAEAAASPGLAKAELAFKRRDRAPFIGKIQLRTVNDADDGERRLEGAVEDVTEKKRLAAWSARADQLAALAELAAGAAHEINNPINGVINWAQVLLDDAPPNSDHAKAAERIIAEGERIAAVVKSLLTFARPAQDAFGPIPVNALIQDVLTLLKHALEREHIRVEFQPTSREIHVRGRENELRQVVVNLVSNARRALNAKFPPGAPQPPENKMLRVSVQPTPEKDRVRILVQDDGVGMTPDVMERIFTPFYTSPAFGGAGLGLAVSAAVVAEHNGEIHFESQPGAYTQAVLDLPPWTGPAPRAQPGA